MRGIRGALWLLASLLVQACGGGAGGETQEPPHPPLAKNVLLIFTEDQGAHAGYLGTPGAVTPATDALVARGASFPNTYITYASCTGSKAAIITGRYNHTIGVNGNVQEYIGSNEQLQAENPPWLTDPNSPYNRNRIREQYPTLIEVLHANGYYLGLQNKLHMSPHSKFPFDVWYEEDGKPYEQVTDFIGKAAAAGKPWFLQHVVNISHRPYPNADTQALDIDQSAVSPPPHLPPTAVSRQDWAEYLQAVLYADQRVGRVLEALRDSGQEDETLIVLLGDHGPSYHRGKLTTYDLGLHVAMSVVGPSIAPGGRYPQLISGVDLMPTLLGYMGITPPTGLQGISFESTLTGGAQSRIRDHVVGETASDRSIYDGRYRLVYMPDAAGTSMAADNRDFDPWRNRVYSHIRDNKDSPGFELFYRLLDLADSQLPMFQRPRFELFDTQADPGELNDLYGNPAHADAQNRLLGELRSWMEQTADTLPRP